MGEYIVILVIILKLVFILTKIGIYKIFIVFILAIIQVILQIMFLEK